MLTIDNPESLADLPFHDTGKYSEFVVELRSALENLEGADVTSLLDGRAGQRCLELVSRQTIRELGSHFTSSALAEQVVRELPIESWDLHRAFDPACGAGDLLLPIARRLSVRNTMSETLRFWNSRLAGCDLSGEFIEAARLRLVLLAASRGVTVDDNPSNLASLLTNVAVGDGLSILTEYGNSSVILMNPPYGKISGAKSKWRSGSATAAALFVERAVMLGGANTYIAAILPEVLRTGTSYARWRSFVSNYAVTTRCKSVGLFSNHADVDVFVCHYHRREVLVKNRPESEILYAKTVGDQFDVSVGTVVPHRHAQEGPRYAYLHAKNAKPRKEIRRISESRQFMGRTFEPPVVLIRRTSRPGDRNRAIATLVLGHRRVAVENHLIVAQPRDGSVETCRFLMRILDSSETDAYLDEIIRCRHLTTLSVCSIPFSQTPA